MCPGYPGRRHSGRSDAGFVGLGNRMRSPIHVDRAGSEAPSPRLTVGVRGYSLPAGAQFFSQDCPKCVYMTFENVVRSNRMVIKW